MFLSATLLESTEQDMPATLLESAEMKMFLLATLLESTEQDRSVGFKIPSDCNSGMDAKRGDICSIISLWQGAVVTQDMATVIGGSADWGLVQKVRDKFAQSTTRLVFQSQGSPRTIGAEG